MAESYWMTRAVRARLSRRAALRGASLSAAGLAAAGVVGCSSSKNNNGGNGNTNNQAQSQVTTIARSAPATPGAISTAAPAAGGVAATPTETPVSGGILTTVIGVDPPTGDFDILQGQSVGVIQPIMHIYNRLLKLGYDANYTIGPDLAATVEQPSATEITLKLRPNVQWHDGQPFSADDVVATLDFIRNPPMGITSPRKKAFAAVDSITAVDANTISIKLSAPSAALTYNLANPFNSIAAKHILATKGNLKTDNIGTGAFKFQQYTKGVETRLVKFDNYWNKGLPYLDGITVKIIADITQTRAAFATKQLLEGGLITSAAGKAWVDSIRKDLAGKATVYRVYSTLPPYVMFNVTKKPYDDPRVRHALALAIDMKDAASGVGYGEARIAGPIGADPWALSDADVATLPGYSANKDKDYADAKAMLSAAGVANLKFDLQYWSASDYADNASYLAQAFTKIGVTANPVGNDTATVNAKRNEANFDVIYYIDGLGTNDPDDWLNSGFLTGGGLNYGKFSNMMLDAQLTAQSQELDFKKRKTLTDQIQKDLVNTHVPRIFLPLRPIWRAAWNDLRNYRVGPDLYGHFQVEADYLKPA